MVFDLATPLEELSLRALQARLEDLEDDADINTHWTVVRKTQHQQQIQLVTRVINQKKLEMLITGEYDESENR